MSSADPTTITRLLSTADLSDDDIVILQGILKQYRVAKVLPGRIPTSELINRAARMINDLMLGRGVDQRNGFEWQAFVRELYDRAAAFKAHEDEGRE